MYDELKEKAIENLKAERAKKRDVYTVGLIFTAVSIILYVVSLNFYNPVAYWIKFPILVLALVFAIIYFSTFGFPFLSNEEFTEEEIEREIVKIYKSGHSNKGGILDEDERLQLREIEELRSKYDDDEEFV